MKPGVRIAGFAVVLAAALAVGAGVGAAIGPSPTRPAAMEPVPVGEGVVSTADGYRLVPSTGTLPAAGGTYRFVIGGPDGNRAHAFTALHERMLHLIVVNRELTVYHHVHPAMASDGTWSVALPALPPGSYRAVADFHVTGGPRLALGADLAVPGGYRPTHVPPSSTVAVIEGYRVTIGTHAKRGGELAISLTVRNGGRLVTDLQPYLGASGHLVAMRAADLAYAHVHPLGYSAGTVTFDATLAAQGRYRLFFDFKHAGVVRTAAFTFEQGVVTGAPTMEH
ncbi:MAG: hypothetical protein QOD45_682 [Pseudonocardiales bacterium]|nr:hypothetical protein [Pseudonocardiales bacterium]